MARAVGTTRWRRTTRLQRILWGWDRTRPDIFGTTEEEFQMRCARRSKRSARNQAG